MKLGEKWKIIFLDIDGVVCTGRVRFNGFDPIATGRLKEIIDATGAKVVVSSSWRTGILEKTKAQLPEWLREHVIDETICKYHYSKSELVTVRGNEIQSWIENHLMYPWHANPELDEMYKTFKEDGSFKMMNSNKSNKDYTYLILDDDTDMLYWHRNNFINTRMFNGISKPNVKKAIKILNKI